MRRKIRPRSGALAAQPRYPLLVLNNYSPDSNRLTPLAALTTLREGGIDGDEEQRRQLGGDGAAQGVRGDAQETISLRVAGG